MEAFFTPEVLTSIFGNLSIGGIFLAIAWRLYKDFQAERLTHRQEMTELINKYSSRIDKKDENLNNITNEFKEVVITTTKVNSELVGNVRELTNITNMVYSEIKRQ